MRAAGRPSRVSPANRREAGADSTPESSRDRLECGRKVEPGEKGHTAVRLFGEAAKYGTEGCFFQAASG